MNRNKVIRCIDGIVLICVLISSATNVCSSWKKHIIAGKVLASSLQQSVHVDNSIFEIEERGPKRKKKCF